MSEVFFIWKLEEFEKSKHSLKGCAGCSIPSIKNIYELFEKNCKQKQALRNDKRLKRSLDSRASGNGNLALTKSLKNNSKTAMLYTMEDAAYSLDSEIHDKMCEVDALQSKSIIFATL